MVTTALLAETGSISKSNGEVTYFHDILVHQISKQRLLNVDKIFTIFTKDSLRYFECTNQPCGPNNSRRVALLSQLLRTKVSYASSVFAGDTRRTRRPQTKLVSFVLIHQFPKLSPNTLYVAGKINRVFNVRRNLWPEFSAYFCSNPCFTITNVFTGNTVNQPWDTRFINQYYLGYKNLFMQLELLTLLLYSVFHWRLSLTVVHGVGRGVGERVVVGRLGIPRIQTSCRRRKSPSRVSALDCMETSRNTATENVELQWNKYRST